jgi:hypothetical protein
MARKTNTAMNQNRNASIRTREDRRGNFRTETYRRSEDSVNVAVSTKPSTDSTMLFVDSPDGQSVSFDGRTARTIYRALKKHYEFTQKSV